VFDPTHKVTDPATSGVKAIADLIAPISDEQPCGSDLSFSPEFDAIEELRRADDPTLEQGEWITTLKQADWAGAEQACRLLLQTRTKDLRVAAWLVEAATHNDGFVGLEHGLLLMTELATRYWDRVHPLPEHGTQEQRVGNLAWLLDRVRDSVTIVPLTDAESGRFCARDLADARALAMALERAGDPANVPTEGKITVEAFDRARRDTRPEFLQQNYHGARAAAAALAALQTVLDEKLGLDGPAFAAAREVLDDLVHETERLARESGALPEQAARSSPAAPSAGATASALQPTTGGVADRAQALQMLRTVAEFFRRTEPHSPVAYLATKAAQWGDMPLHVWLRQVIKDPSALSNLEEMLGVEPKGES
jgi:type VI secretion system protein ImpA